MLLSFTFYSGLFRANFKHLAFYRTISSIFMAIGSKPTGKLIVDFEGRSVVYDFGELDEVSLAYAITIHKTGDQICRITCVSNIPAVAADHGHTASSVGRRGRRAVDPADQHCRIQLPVDKKHVLRGLGIDLPRHDVGCETSVNDEPPVGAFLHPCAIATRRLRRSVKAARGKQWRGDFIG